MQSHRRGRIRRTALGLGLIAACGTLAGSADTRAAGAPADPPPASPAPLPPAEGGPAEGGQKEGDGAVSMEGAVAQALRRNPTLEIARRERNVALMEADRYRPAFRPEVTASASQLLRTPRVDLPGEPNDVVLPNSVSRFQISMRHPIYQFGAGSAPEVRATALAAAAESDYRKAELDTVLQVREAYLDLLHTAAMAELARQGEELAREHTRVTRLLQERGFQADVDVLEAERAQAEAEAGRLQAENGTALARANLNRLLSRAVDAPLAPAPPADLPPGPGSLAELLPRALEGRPEIAALRHNIEAAEAGIRLARAGKQPRVSLEAEYALQTRTVLEPHSGLGAGISFSMPLFDGGVTRRTVREAEERLAQLRSALAAQEGGVALEIERQRLAMGEARARIQVADRAIAAASRAYDIVRAKLELGRAIQVEVQNARQGLERARSDRAAAERDLRLARIRLDRALGEDGTHP